MNKKEKDRITAGLEGLCNFFVSCNIKGLIGKGHEPKKTKLGDVVFAVASRPKKRGSGSKVLFYSLEPHKEIKLPYGQKDVFNLKVRNGQIYILSAEIKTEPDEKRFDIYQLQKNDRPKFIATLSDEEEPFFDIYNGRIFFSRGNNLFTIDKNNNITPISPGGNTFSKRIDDLISDREGLVISSDGKIHLYNPSSNELQIFDSDAERLTKIKKAGTYFAGVDDIRDRLYLIEDDKCVEMSYSSNVYALKNRGKELHLIRSSLEKNIIHEIYEDINADGPKFSGILAELHPLTIFYSFDFFNNYLFCMYKSQDMDQLMIFDENFKKVKEDIRFYNVNFNKKGFANKDEI